MTTNKPKKTTKYHAHTTHGGGHRKKRRGAGSRGGRGNAGSGKRSKVKKQITPKLGKHGFTPRNKKTTIKTINLGQLETRLQNKTIEVKDEVVNLTALKYHKLLSTGNFTQKVKIKVAQFSSQTEAKVQEAGGSLISGKQETTKPKETKKEQPDVTEEEKSE